MTNFCIKNHHDLVEGEIWRWLKCPHLVVVRQHMQKCIDVSIQITSILESFNLVEPFSIDEQFLDVTHSLHLFGTPFETSQLIQEDID